MSKRYKIISLSLLIGLAILMTIFLYIKNINILERSVVNENNLNSSYRQYNKSYKLDEIPLEAKNIILAANAPLYYQCNFSLLSTIYYLFQRNFDWGKKEQLCINNTHIENTVIRMFSDKKSNNLYYFYYFVLLSANYNKDEILEFYINNIEFEDGIYGFPMASHYYFNKPLEALDQEELKELTLNILNGRTNFTEYARKLRMDYLNKNLR